MPNPIAYLALIAWPLVAMAIFKAHKDRNLERAIIWLVIWPALFLPERTNIDLPVIPPLDKVVIPNLVLVALLLGLKARDFKVLPENPIGRLLVIAITISPFATSLANGNPMFNNVHWIPGTTFYDAFTDLLRALIFIIPFIIGRSFLASAEAHREILRTLLLAGIVYSALIVFENRFSPQLHTWIYGFFQHSFNQHVRGGFFRPAVFMEHGLWVAFFAMSASVSAAILWRSMSPSFPQFDTDDTRPRRFYLMMTVYLFTVLCLCWSMGSILFGIVLLPLVLFTSPKTQLRIAAALALIAVLYPALRGAGWIPVDWLLEQAGQVSAVRKQSLGHRFHNEDQMLAHAANKPFLGWGGWGRNLIYDVGEWVDTITVPDGFWIIIIGTRGWLGYLAYFGLLALPILAVLWRIRQSGAATLTPVTAGLCLLLAINMVELLPNATLPTWTWLIAGSLLGFAEKAKSSLPAQETARKEPKAVPRRRTIL